MNKSLDEHFREFKDTDFTLFEGMLSKSWMKHMIESFEELSERAQYKEGDDKNVLSNLLEQKADYVLPALTNTIL
jgi:hypothetical protein